MFGFVKPQIRIEETTAPNYGKFIVEPLESGFGVTLGNLFRRVLLSSLPGAAVTAVRIEGLQHEFSTVPHVKEDVIQFLLNTKRIRLKYFNAQTGSLQLEVEGAKTVVARDIKPSADFEIVNPDLHLATLDSDDARLNVELYVEMGKGYIPAGSSDGLPVGVIPTDAIFTPITRVNYAVGKTRVGQVTGYDLLTLEIWTDGTITPKEALVKAAQMVAEQVQVFVALGMAVGEAEKGHAAAIPPEKYELRLENLGLSARTLNALRRSGITKVGELVEKPEDELLKLRSFGQKSLLEVRDRLIALDLLPKPPEGQEPTPIGGAEESAEDEDSEEPEDEEESEEERAGKEQ